MWYELRELLPKEERTYAYLLGICRRAADARDIGSIGELDPKQMHKAIEALKKRLGQEDKSEPSDGSDEVPF